MMHGELAEPTNDSLIMKLMESIRIFLELVRCVILIECSIHFFSLLRFHVWLFLCISRTIYREKNMCECCVHHRRPTQSRSINRKSKRDGQTANRKKHPNLNGVICVIRCWTRTNRPDKYPRNRFTYLDILCANAPTNSELIKQDFWCSFFASLLVAPNSCMFNTVCLRCQLNRIRNS